ncbi:MAG: hypothetical protein ACPGSB_04900 [Opitutales bacterium]
MASPTILPGQLRLILAIAAVHIIGWYAYLGQVPLGLYPTAEESAMLDAAIALAEGTAPEGMTLSAYEFALSIGARFAENEQALILMARMLNAIALLLATLMCAHTAGQYWKKNRPVWIAGLLTGLNPVLVFWSAEISPALLAVLFASLNFAFLLRWLKQPTPQRSLALGLLLVLSSAFETNLIFMVLLWPIAAFLYPNKKKAYHLGAALTFPALAFIFLAVSNFQLQSTPEVNVANIGHGLYEFFNSHEPYDGKSYGLHKQLNPLLFLNPLHWGLIFILAICGAYIRLKNGHKGNSIAALVICLTIYAVSYALNGGGSKARALFYPILAIYAGGISMLPQVWIHAGILTKRKLAIGILLLAGLCYSNFYDARSHRNWEADYSFLAVANLALERNKSAIEWAEKTLELNPARNDMKSITLQATFNQWALTANPLPLSIETTKLYLEAARESDLNNPETRALEALYLFKIRETQEAVAIWRDVSDESALALTCLYWTGQVGKPSITQLEAYKEDPYFELLENALQINRNALAYNEGEAALNNMLANAH